MKRITGPVFLSLLAIVAATLVAGCSSSTQSSAGSASPSSSGTGTIQAAPGWPSVQASDFVRTIDNPWFPLITGYTWLYKGVKDGKPTVDRFVATGQTKSIEGVTCTVVHDVTTVHGKPIEKTLDWYAQDRQGNVWYFGESTAEYNDAGEVTSTAGTWQSGVKGAKPGIFMPADPTVGAGGYQEYYRGQALDRYEVVSLNGSITVPYGSFKQALLTRETTALEPGVVDHKYYVKGIGQVAEESVKGAHETSYLSTFREQ